MSAPLAQLRRRFAALNPREQRLVLFASGVLALAALYLAGEWLYTENRRVARELPVAQARLARMQAEADELQRLPPRQSAAESTETLLEAARAAARSRGLELAIDNAADGIKVSGSASFDALVDWLASVQAQQRLRPARLQLNGQGSRVGVDALLVRSDG